MADNDMKRQYEEVKMRMNKTFNTHQGGYQPKKPTGGLPTSKPKPPKSFSLTTNETSGFSPTKNNSSSLSIDADRNSSISSELGTINGKLDNIEALIYKLIEVVTDDSTTEKKVQKVVDPATGQSTFL